MIPTGGRGEDGKVLPPPSTFLLLLLWPDYVDYLRLTDNCRLVYEKGPDSDWIGKEELRDADSMESSAGEDLEKLDIK